MSGSTRKAATPTRISSGATAETPKEKICTISAVPTLAPSIAASPGTSATAPAAQKEATMKAVAVLLWSSDVTSSPAAKPRRRFASALPSRCRSRVP